LRLGIVLFERSTCGVNLTQAGMRFLDRARQVLDDLACGRISALL
jgi:DNA-binding transcriptional LysR family regulator